MIATSTEICCTLELFDNSNIIIVDDIFLELFTNREQESVLYHELGHIYNTDDNDNSINNEINADMYSLENTSIESLISVLHKTMEFIEYIYKDIDKSYINQIKDIIKIRLENLESRQ